MKRQFIYFIRRADGEGPIKIGCSGWPQIRLLQLNCDHKADLCIIAVAPGDFATESNLHRKFGADRVVVSLPRRSYTYGGQNEWYTATPALLTYIDHVKATGTIALDPAERRELVYRDRYLAGETLRSIGDSYGITRERVRQILHKHGYPSNPRARSKYLRAESMS